MNVIKSTGSKSKKIATQMARQAAREPLEILKTAGSQVTGKEKSSTSVKVPPVQSTEKLPQNGTSNESEIKMRSERLLNANRTELDQIRKQKVFADIQKRISEGEEVPLENIEELSMEQKQVLKAQMEAVKIRNSKDQTEKFVAPVGKQKKGMIGMKGKIQKMKQRAELRKGPTG